MRRIQRQMQVMQMTTDRTDRELTTRTELQVNGRKVELNDFVQSFIGQTVIGMVQSLRDVEDVQRIHLEISKSSEQTFPDA